jgi:RNA polymerase sigma-70 factor (ECF subfamily)
MGELPPHATPLSEVFVRELATERPSDCAPVEATPALEGLLGAALVAGRAAWPSVKLEGPPFVAHVAGLLASEGDVSGALQAMRASEVYLACALAQGDARAVAAFEARYLSEVASFIAQIDRSPTFADDVRQQLREKLLVRSVAGRAPKIAEFTGRGPLGGWLRVAAVRTALNLKRGTARASEDVGAELASLAPDPELDYLKTRYGKELREALQTTLASLSADERTVLRMHYIDGLNIDEIGVTYRVHRSTVARWLAASREKILEETKRILSKSLRIDKQEVESMIGLVRSQLDASIHRFLAKA